MKNVINRLQNKKVARGVVLFSCYHGTMHFGMEEKKSMKVRRRGDTEECFYPWNGAACELMCIHSENKTL